MSRGRKTNYEEMKSSELAKLSTDECIKALKRQKPYQNIDDEIVLELASKFALKAMPQIVDANMNHNIQSMGTITIDGVPMSIDIG